MLRFPKGKVLYITLESTVECHVGISMTHNKKEAPDMTVASVYSSQGNMDNQRGTTIRRASQVSLTSGNSSEEDLTGGSRNLNKPIAALTEEELIEELNLRRVQNR